MPAVADRNWDVPINANAGLIDALAAVGPLAVRFAEFPSASLNVAVIGGTFIKSDGTLVSYAGTSSQAMTTATTNYVYLTDAGTLTVSTSGFPATTFHVRLATVVAGATTLTSVADSRLPWSSNGKNRNTIYLALSGGTLDDSAGVVTIGTGTTNGTKIGASVSDKIALWGGTPVVQPSGAGQAALPSVAAATLTDSTTGTAGATIGDVGASFSQATLNSIHASLLSQINKLITDRDNGRTLLTAIRSAILAWNGMKGSA